MDKADKLVADIVGGLAELHTITMDWIQDWKDLQCRMEDMPIKVKAPYRGWPTGSTTASLVAQMVQRATKARERIFVHIERLRREEASRRAQETNDKKKKKRR